MRGGVMLLHEPGGTLQVTVRQVCWTCGAAPVARCTACALVCYCNAACQRADRSRHKHACKALPAAVLDVATI
jgi:hypothetical protein